MCLMVAVSVIVSESVSGREIKGSSSNRVDTVRLNVARFYSGLECRSKVHGLQLLLSFDLLKKSEKLFANAKFYVRFELPNSTSVIILYPLHSSAKLYNGNYLNIPQIKVDL